MQKNLIIVHAPRMAQSVAIGQLWRFRKFLQRRRSTRRPLHELHQYNGNLAGFSLSPTYCIKCFFSETPSWQGLRPVAYSSLLDISVASY